MIRNELEYQEAVHRVKEESQRLRQHSHTGSEQL